MAFNEYLTYFRRSNKYSSQILLVFVFFLVLYAFVGSSIKISVIHQIIEKTSDSSTDISTKMDYIEAELTLKYEFTAEELIKEGRISRENVEEIRTWISNLNDKYVPSRVQDEMIVIFLISCSNDVELTKKTIVSYYLLKKQGPEIFDDRDLNRSDIKLALNTIHMSSIPVRTEENDVFHYFNLHDTNYRNFDLIPIMKVSYMLMDIAQEKNPPSGLIVVIDMKGAGIMHMTRINMKAIKKYLTFLQEGFPMKLKMIYFINAVYFMDKLLAIAKMFMKSELMSMVSTFMALHNSKYTERQSSNLSTWIRARKIMADYTKKYLPKEYGGDLPSEKELHEKTLELFKSKQEFWDLEEKIRKQVYSE